MSTKYFGIEEEIINPLITRVDFSKIQPKLTSDHQVTLHLFCILHSEKCIDEIMYGQTKLDFSNGTLISFRPNQTMVIPAKNIPNLKKDGWGLYFHPDFIRKHHLGSYIEEYSFFEYEMNEALHLSPLEKQKINNLVDEIIGELSGNIDKYTRMIVISNIELLLNYVQRFYSRQFITREKSNHGILSKFEKYIKTYIHAGNLEKKGMITVQNTAEALNLSPNYLGDLLKKETGKNAIEHIHLALVEQAKNKLLQSNDSIKEIAYQLGFEYAQSFSKMFKNATGLTPTNYRQLN